MKYFPFRWSFFFLLSLSFLSVAKLADAHGYLVSPRARNFVAWQDGVWSYNENNRSAGIQKYYKESCPQCASIGGTRARCGIIGTTNYDIPRSIDGSILPSDPQRIVNRGDETITVDVILTAHHKGHFEFSACPISTTSVAPTQECFDEYPLEMIRDELYGAPQDGNYTNRAYIPPYEYPRMIRVSGGLDSPGYGQLFRYTLKLPPTLTGFVLLQWHYLTANSCEYHGYDTYDFPSDWGIMRNGIGLCEPLPSDGIGCTSLE